MNCSHAMPPPENSYDRMAPIASIRDTAWMRTNSKPHARRGDRTSRKKANEIPRRVANCLARPILAKWGRRGFDKNPTMTSVDYSSVTAESSVRADGVFPCFFVVAF